MPTESLHSLSPDLLPRWKKNQECASCKCQNPHLGKLNYLKTNLQHEMFMFIVYFTVYSCNYHYLRYVLSKKTHILEQAK